MGNRAFIPTDGVHEIEREPFNYNVESRKSPKTYRVELEKYNWNGWCGCPKFEFSMQPLLERGANPASNLRCWHIDRARDFFIRKWGPVMAAQYYKNNGEQPPAQPERFGHGQPPKPESTGRDYTLDDRKKYHAKS